MQAQAREGLPVKDVDWWRVFVLVVYSIYVGAAGYTFGQEKWRGMFKECLASADQCVQVLERAQAGWEMCERERR